jgi:hypothetical protein
VVLANQEMYDKVSCESKDIFYITDCDWDILSPNRLPGQPGVIETWIIQLYFQSGGWIISYGTL